MYIIEFSMIRPSFYNERMTMLKIPVIHHNSIYSNHLFRTYRNNPDELSVDDLIELGKEFREIDENRFQVWVYKDNEERKYRYHVAKTFRKFLDYFNKRVGDEGLTRKQVLRFVQRYSNRALIVKNLYEKAKKKQLYSTISERMWNTVLGVGKNTQFINALIDCGAVVRVYNASGTRKISSIYSLNTKILKEIYDAFDRIPDFWKTCQVNAEIDNETFEELSNGQYSETVSVFQDNALECEDRHDKFVSFCANKFVYPEENVVEDILRMLEGHIFSTGYNYPLRDLDEVAQVYGFIKEWVNEKADMERIRKVANSVYTNQHNYIKYDPTIKIDNKFFRGVGIRAVTELCTKPKFETTLRQMRESLDDDVLEKEYMDEAWNKSRDSILARYGELDHFDVSSSIPHVMYLMNDGVYRVNEDLYYKLSGKPEDWNEGMRTIIKQSYMQSHFSTDSVKKVFNNIRYKYLEKHDVDSVRWLDCHRELMYTFISNVKTETPDGQSTMDFYHESNIFILLRKKWTDEGIKVIGQVYDSFWFEKGIMSEDKFLSDLKTVAEKYYNAYVNGIPFDKIL